MGKFIVFKLNNDLNIKVISSGNKITHIKKASASDMLSEKPSTKLLEKAKKELVSFWLKTKDYLLKLESRKV